MRLRVSPCRLPVARLFKQPARYGSSRRGYSEGVRTDDDTRKVEQELAAGQSESTPVLALSSVIVAVGVLVAIALGLAALAYWLA